MNWLAPPKQQECAIPEFFVRVQCALFVILWTVTMLPNVLIVQNIALILGAIIGIYVITRCHKCFSFGRSIPLVMIALLFIWTTIHLCFLGQNYELQLVEYGSLWKRALLGSIFALGFGLSLIKTKENYWTIIFGGLCLPTGIYYFKYCARLAAVYFGFELPESLSLFSTGVSSYYIPKISYVFYCLPPFAVALGCLLKYFKSKEMNWRAVVAYILVIVAVLGVFYLENIKNGFIYTFLLAFIFFVCLLRGGMKWLSWKSGCLLFGLAFVVAGFIFNNLHTNDSWRSFSADFRVASQAQPSDVWNEGTYVYPLNADGRSVSPTNFDRTFYFITALGFVEKYPLGYGLVHRSFGHIARQNFPNAPLIQSHSGWMDFTLALGIPGALLLLTASILAMLQTSHVISPWSTFGVWSLLSIVLLFLTTEVAQKNFVDTYIWLVVLVSSIGLKNSQARFLGKNIE